MYLTNEWLKTISSHCKMDNLNIFHQIPFKKCFIKSITPQGPSFLYILFGSRIKHITHMDCTLDSCTQLHYFLWEYWIWIFFLDGGDSFLILCHLAFWPIISEILQSTKVKHFNVKKGTSNKNVAQQMPFLSQNSDAFDWLPNASTFAEKEKIAVQKKVSSFLKLQRVHESLKKPWTSIWCQDNWINSTKSFSFCCERYLNFFFSLNE